VRRCFMMVSIFFVQVLCERVGTCVKVLYESVV
jgi:hypothetical protein